MTTTEDTCDMQTAMEDGVLVSGKEPCPYPAFHDGPHKWMEGAPEKPQKRTVPVGAIELNPRWHKCSCGQPAAFRYTNGEGDAAVRVDTCWACYEAPRVAPVAEQLPDSLPGFFDDKASTLPFGGPISEPMAAAIKKRRGRKKADERFEAALATLPDATEAEIQEMIDNGELGAGSRGVKPWEEAGANGEVVYIPLETLAAMADVGREPVLADELGEVPLLVAAEVEEDSYVYADNGQWVDPLTGEVHEVRGESALAYFERAQTYEAPVAEDPHERLSQLAAKVLAENGTFQNTVRMGLQAAYNMGQALAEAKVIVSKLEGVYWEEWVRGEAGIPERSAQRYMQWWNMASLQKMEELPSDMGLIAAMKALSDEKREARKAEQNARAIPHYFLPATCTIEQGDCANLPWPDGSVDLIFTSPPYGLALFEQDDPDQHEAYMELVDQWCAEMHRVAGWQGRVVVNVALDTTKGDTPHPLYCDWLNSLIAAGFTYRTTIMWDEGTVKNAQARGSVDSPASPHVFSRQETLIVVHKGPWGLLEPDGAPSERRSVPRKGETEFQTDEGHAEWVEWLGGHGDWAISNQSAKGLGSFPDELARRVIQTYSFRGDVVADPFTGWGTTPIMAASMGRQAWGVEKNERRVAEAIENAHKRLGESHE